MTAWVLPVGRMLGLGTAAGTRPSLTLAVIGIMYKLDWGVGLNSTFQFLGYWAAIMVFVVMAIFESSFDKIPKIDRLQNRLTMPYRVVVGAVAGACTIPFGWQGIVVGAVVGAAAAWFALYAKQLTRPRTVPSDAVINLMGLWEDLAALAGTLLTLLFSLVGYGVAGFTVVVLMGARYRRRAKYRHMRRPDRRA
jgi:uncharacterized membrane protein